MNMKRINLLMGIFALLAIALGGYYYYKHYMNQDTTPPEIKASQDTIECTIDASTEELCEGLTATDNQDGDISSQIMVSGITVKEDTDITNNEFDISYIVFDSASNMASCTRTLVYTDYTSPRFAISDPLRFSSPYDANESLQTYLTASDCIEGDLSSQITLEFSDELINYSGSGSYECTASVTNRLGDSSTIPLVLEIYSDEVDSAIKRPEITLTDYIVYLKQGEEFKPRSYLDSVTINNQSYTLLNGKAEDYIITDTFDYLTEDADTSLYLMPYGAGYVTLLSEVCMLKSSIQVDNPVDTATPGKYVVNYSIADPDTQQTGNANLIVVVDS